VIVCRGFIDPNILVKYWQGEWGWEVDRVRILEHKKVVKMTEQIIRYGIKELGEVILGTDGRVYDGLHRIAICLELQIPLIPFRLEDPKQNLLNVIKEHGKDVTFEKQKEEI
jgi:hypothetical protein